MKNSPLHQRKLIMHAAHKTVGVSVSAAAWYREDSPGFADPRSTRSVQRVCLLAPSARPNGNASWAFLLSALRTEHREVELQTLQTADEWDPTGTDVPGGPPFDCVVLLPCGENLGGKNINGENFNERAVRRLTRYGRQGGGIVLLGASALVHAEMTETARALLGCRMLEPCGEHFTDSPDDALGNTFPSERSAAGKIVRVDESHPILAGVGPFAMPGPTIKALRIDDEATVLLRETSASMRPVAWCRPLERGRVFCTVLESPDTFRFGAGLRLIDNAVRWSV